MHLISDNSLNEYRLNLPLKKSFKNDVAVFAKQMLNSFFFLGHVSLG